MDDQLRERLNHLFDRIASASFLNSQGIGNEIAFYIFDYPPKEELAVRQHVARLVDRLKGAPQDIRPASVNLFRLVIDFLKELGFLDMCFRLQRDRGNRLLLEALEGPLAPERVAGRLASVARPDRYNLILIHGVGSAYPLLRTHELLAALHQLMDQIPAVLFFPGTYEDGSLQLFGGTSRALNDRHYYRALRLVP